MGHNFRFIVAGVGLGLATWASSAVAANLPPPAGNVVLDLNGTPIPHSYQQYTTGIFTSAGTSTNISFAFREDPAYFSIDDITVRDVTTGMDVPVVNGGFESGPAGSSTPFGFTYLNLYNAPANGRVVENSTLAHTGNFLYYDGSVGSYDTITQAIATTPNDLYSISFYLSDNSNQLTFSRTAVPGLAGIDVVVYAGDLPTLPGVPLPSSAPMFGAALLALGAVGYGMKRKKATSAA